MQTRKVFWKGRHRLLKDKSGKPLTSPLGRLPSSVLAWLCSRYGWSEITLDNPTLPLFAFANKNCGDFATCGSTICQLPEEYYARVDDKLALTLLLANSTTDLMPPTLEANDLVATANTEDYDKESVWFVKHRYGVKGRAVYLFKGLVAAQTWLDTHTTNKKDFIVQQEVIPLLLNKRRFTIRAHVLFTTLPEAVYIHKDCICLPHKTEYTPGSVDKTVQISSFNNNTGKVFLLADTSELHEKIFPRLVSNVSEVHKVVREQIVPATNPNNQRQLHYHLFGYDYAVDWNVQPKLLEINAFPALGTGTMSGVPAKVFNDLLKDLIRVVVLPHLDPTVQPIDHGFVQAFSGG